MVSSHRQALTASAVIAAFFLTAACSGNRANQVVDTATGTVATQTAQPSADDLDDRVEDALDADSTLRQFRLAVDDDDNKIVLEGAVRSEEQKTLAQ